VIKEEWDRIMAVNLKSAFFCAQAVVPDMKEGKWGRLIFMSSLAGRMGGYVNGLGYSAAEAGMIGLARGPRYAWPLGYYLKRHRAGND
jgi:3-oxoacyl-[acyl-carrier protein] reductase